MFIYYLFFRSQSTGRLICLPLIVLVSFVQLQTNQDAPLAVSLQDKSTVIAGKTNSKKSMSMYGTEEATI